MKSKILGLLAAGLLVGPMVASAAIIGGTYDFTATGFGPSSIDPVVGSFTISFDDSVSVTDTTSGLSNVTINLLADGGVGYSYDHVNDTLFIGGLAGGTGNAVGAANDWRLLVQNFVTSPFAFSFAYTQSSVPSARIVFAPNTTISRRTGVPEPGTLALLGLGLVGLGLSRRRKAN